MTIFEHELRNGILVQGLTGSIGRVQVDQMSEYGTRVVGGVTPGRGGESVDGIPVFDTVAQAVEATGARASIAFLPPRFAVSGIVEAAEAGIELLVCPTEGIPLQGATRAIQVSNQYRMRLIGPNTSGFVIPGLLKMGFMPTDFVRPGRCAVLSRSGTLSYEVVNALNAAQIGVSVWIGVGGDRVKGTTFAEILPTVIDDATTDAVVIIGEIGGNDEEKAAELLSQSAIPAMALFAGRTAPTGVSMGHAGAIISGNHGSYASKVEAMTAAGIPVATHPDEVATWAISVLGTNTAKTKIEVVS